MTKAYRVQEFAELSGVTVRALHHYDRLGLLRPARTESGYRMYGVRDLERLEQIVALKFLGIPLKQIKPLLERDASKLPDALLAAKRRALEEKRRRLDLAIGAIRDAETLANPAALKTIIEVIEMQDSAEQMKKYYSDEAWAKLAENREKGPAGAGQKGSEAWAALFKDVEASLDIDPASEKAQALLVRWKALVNEFTGGDPAIASGLRSAWADKAKLARSGTKSKLCRSNTPSVSSSSPT